MSWQTEYLLFKLFLRRCLPRGLPCDIVSAMRKKNAVILFILISFLICSCTKAYHPYSRRAFCFDTVADITLYDEDAKYTDSCLQICEEAQELYSMYSPSSLLYSLNAGEPSDTSGLIPVLEAALSWSDKTGAAVDPAIGAVSSLWNFHDKDTGSCPDKEAVSKALTHTAPDSFMITHDPDGIIKNDPEALIDLGFITKGYVSKQIRDHLTGLGVKSGIINLGGNVVVMGTKPDGSSYTVGIQRPFAAAPMLTINVSDTAVVTSGIYERCFEYEGRLYHHILDPKTGYPVDNDLYSVTIISDDPVAADALSTACFVMGKEEGLRYIEGIDNAEALFIDKDYEIYTSSGFPEYSLTD